VQHLEDFKTDIRWRIIILLILKFFFFKNLNFHLQFYKFSSRFSRSYFKLPFFQNIQPNIQNISVSTYNRLLHPTFLIYERYLLFIRIYLLGAVMWGLRGNKSRRRIESSRQQEAKPGLSNQPDPRPNRYWLYTVFCVSSSARVLHSAPSLCVYACGRHTNLTTFSFSSSCRQQSLAEDETSNLISDERV